jgi:hypothetical protein
MAIYAVIEEATGKIVNSIVLDDVDAWPVPEGHFIVEQTDVPLGIGGIYIDGVYTPPPQPSLPPPPINPDLDSQPAQTTAQILGVS